MVCLELNAGMLSLLLAIALSACRPASAASLLDWIGFGSESSDRIRDLSVKDGVPLLKVPFEEASPEDKFLQEAEKFISLKQSELDKCQHRVVMKISSSCGSITDEELAKLSVNLLNCQSAVEGRQQFPCNENMSLRDCTKNMDSDMWNTYHLMNNRARAVCYSARHQQFRALSEMTVNKLMTAAHEQLQSMDSLKDGQSKLESLAANAMDTLSRGHQALLEEHEKLRFSTQSVHDFVALNLRELTREKALIAAGQRELSLMTKQVKSKLDQASDQLTDQASEREKNHLQLLADLESLQRKTFDIWERVDSSSSQILAQHAAASQDLDHMLKNLVKINASIEYLLKTVEKTRSDIDERLGWIVKILGESGDQMEWIQQCLGHGLYLVLGMVAASFLQAPFVVRCALLAIVPLNLLLSSYEGSERALDFPGMTILIFVFAAAQWLLTSVQQLVYPSQPHAAQFVQGNFVRTQSAVAPMVCNGNSNINTFIESGVSAYYYASMEWLRKMLKQCQWNALKLEAGKVYQQCRSWLTTSRSPQSHVEHVSDEPPANNDPAEGSDDEGSVEQELTFRPQPSYSSAFHRVAMARSDSPASSRSSRSFTPVRSGSPKTQCGAFTRTGQQCRNSAVSGSSMCRTHNVASPSRG